MDKVKRLHIYVTEKDLKYVDLMDRIIAQDFDFRSRTDFAWKAIKKQVKELLPNENY